MRVKDFKIYIYFLTIQYSQVNYLKTSEYEFIIKLLIIKNK